MITKRDLLRSAALAAITVTTAKAVPANAQAKAEWPNLIEAKAIAEEGFIYGLPIVMNYAVMYEFAVDRTSGQFKAPFNQIDNMARVATYKDTAVVTPNSDTPYSVLWFDLRAEPIVVSVPAVEEIRYYKAQPLSAYLKQPAPSAAPAIDFPKADAELVKKNFFEHLDFALQFAPAGPEERAIREKLARIGVGAGKTFEFKDLPLTHKLEIGLGMKDGEEKVEKYLASGSKNINGWKVGSLFGD